MNSGDYLGLSEGTSDDEWFLVVESSPAGSKHHDVESLVGGIWVTQVEFLSETQAQSVTYDVLGASGWIKRKPGFVSKDYQVAAAFGVIVACDKSSGTLSVTQTEYKGKKGSRSGMIDEGLSGKIIDQLNNSRYSVGIQASLTITDDKGHAGTVKFGSMHVDGSVSLIAVGVGSPLGSIHIESTAPLPPSFSLATTGKYRCECVKKAEPVTP